MKKILAVVLAMLMVFAALPTMADGTAAPLGKVGDTKYYDLDEMIAAWTKGTTLTLLSDVQLTDVIRLDNREPRTLDLGTYTLTAASGKNAIILEPFGDIKGSNPIHYFTINADAANPGGIYAPGKACIESIGNNNYTCRMELVINGGVFEGSYSIKHTNSLEQSAPWITINGGEFKSQIWTDKAKIHINDGVFRKSNTFKGTETGSYTVISGGRFYSMGFMTNKVNAVCFGTDTKQLTNYNCDVYMDEEGYYCVAPATDKPGQFGASVSSSGVNSYVKAYSNVKNEGSFYYTDANYALSKNTSTTVKIYEDADVDITTSGNLVIDASYDGASYTGNITLANDNATFSVILSDGEEYTGKVYQKSGLLNAETVVENGVTTVKYTNNTTDLSEAVAMIGDCAYRSLEEAVEAAADGDVITIVSDIALSEIEYTSPKTAYQFKGYAGLIIPGDKEVTIDLNGYSLTYADTHGGCDSVAVYNIGNLTVNDSSDAKTGSICYVDVHDNVNYNQNHAVVFNVGVLTVNDGTIEHFDTGAGTVSDAIDNNSNIGYNYGNDVICTINGGTLVGAEYRAIRQYTHYNEGVLNRVTVNGGTIKGGIYLQHGDSWYYADPSVGRLNVDCQLMINGGTITSLDDGYGHIRSYLCNPDNNSFGIEINGGTLEVPVQVYVQKGARYSEDGTASTGTVIKSESTGARTAEFIETNGGFINGGTFTDMGDKDDATTNLLGFLSEDTTLMKNGYNLFTVINANDTNTEDDVLDALSADSVSIQYRDVTDAEAEGEKVYEIVVKANDDEDINELASVDLSFMYTSAPAIGGNIEFTVAPADDFSMSRYGNEERYMFNYNGVTAYEGSGNEIAVGTITVTGYGTFGITTVYADTNIVNATTVSDNLVDSYTGDGARDNDPTTGALIINTDTVDGDGLIGEVVGGNIPVPTETLTVNIKFPNAVKPNDSEYQNMKVQITGNIEGVNQTVTYALGADMTDGAYVVVEDRLVRNESYTVTVSGAGYRTARYTVTMTDTKIINFWNNVMDNEMVIEEGKDSSKTTKNFLAGDIVKDAQINIYDLSAVVSYFGESSDVENGYAKYDLNRDGVIDSKDVAYVLVSWNE